MHLLIYISNRKAGDEMSGNKARRIGGKIMRRRLLGGLLLLLAGCTATATPKIPLSPADLDPHEGIVIYGLSVSGGQPTSLGVYPGVWGYWIAYDPATGKRIGKDSWAMKTGNGIFMADDMKSGATGYRFLKLPPGDYAIGFMRDITNKVAVNYMLVAGTLEQLYNQYLSGARAEIGDPTLQADARVLPSTPRFHVGAGEIVYIGDLHFDVGDRFALRWSLDQNEAAARAFARTAGADAAARMISRPLMHVDGTPIRRPDVIASMGTFSANQGSQEPTPTTADAAAAGAAISAFGLVGTWSADCSKDVSDGPGRVTFALPASGAPTIVSENRLLRTHLTILSAERIGDNQLHLRAAATRVDVAANARATASAGQELDQIIEKTGDTYRIQQSQRVGGDTLVKDGMLVLAKPPIPSPLMAKCSAP